MQVKYKESIQNTGRRDYREPMFEIAIKAIYKYLENRGVPESELQSFEKFYASLINIAYRSRSIKSPWGYAMATEPNKKIIEAIGEALMDAKVAINDRSEYGYSWEHIAKVLAHYPENLMRKAYVRWKTVHDALNKGKHGLDLTFEDNKKKYPYVISKEYLHDLRILTDLLEWLRVKHGVPPDTVKDLKRLYLFLDPLFGKDKRHDLDCNLIWRTLYPYWETSGIKQTDVEHLFNTPDVLKTILFAWQLERQEALLILKRKGAGLDLTYEHGS